ARRAGDHRAHLGGWVHRHTDLDLRRARSDAREYVLGDRFVDHEAARRSAALTLHARVVHTADDRGGDLIAVDVGEHDDRVLATELERERLEVTACGGAGLDPQRGRRAPGEGDPLDARVTHDRV